MHHLAFLVWLPTRIFATPNYPHFTPKTPLFDGCFAPFGHVFHSSKRFCLYHLQWIFMLFVSHLAPFHLAFSTKTHSILHQNARHFAPKRKAFSNKTHSILLQIAPKQVQRVVFLNKNSFCPHLKPPPFCTDTNPRENRFFAARRTIGGKKSTHNVKILAEKLTMLGRLTSRQVDKLTRG